MGRIKTVRIRIFRMEGFAGWERLNPENPKILKILILTKCENCQNQDLQD
jgi:hypothetical protein